MTRIKKTDNKIANKKRSFLGKKDKKKKKRKNSKGSLSNAFISQIAPFGNILFKSDYFRTGLFYGAVVTFLPEQGHVTSLPPMWGRMLVPVFDSDDDELSQVSARLVIAAQVRDKRWVEDHLSNATDVTEGGYEDAMKARQGGSATQFQRQHMDVQIASDEIAQGASYLDVTYRIVIYGPTLEILRRAIHSLEVYYQSRFGSVKLTQYVGQQEQDYQNLLAPSLDQLGLHDGFTSTELSGFYPFNGKLWMDDRGDFVGQAVGDMTRSPVIWDMSTLGSVSVVASNDHAHLMAYAEPLEFMATDGWLNVLVKDALLDGHDVYEIVLSDVDVTNIGIDISESTIDIPMNTGSINMLQAFGKTDDELQLYTVLLNKIKSMLKQLNPDLRSEDLNEMDKILEDFFVGQNMWSPNPEENRAKLRITGLRDNSQYPTLNMLVVHLNQMLRREQQNGLKAKQYSRLLSILESMRHSYSYLFNVTTSFDEKRMNKRPRKVFNFGRLQRSGSEVLMAQFINTLAFIVSHMKRGDKLVIHGADLISDVAFSYLNDQLYTLKQQQNGLIFGFNSTTAAINSPVFDMSTTVLMGQMSASNIEAYQEKITGKLPAVLLDQMTSGDDRIFYLRRNRQNVAFAWDTLL